MRPHATVHNAHGTQNTCDSPFAAACTCSPRYASSAKITIYWCVVVVVGMPLTSRPSHFIHSRLFLRSLAIAFSHRCAAPPTFFARLLMDFLFLFSAFYDSMEIHMQMGQLQLHDAQSASVRAKSRSHRCSAFWLSRTHNRTRTLRSKWIISHGANNAIFQFNEWMSERRSLLSRQCGNRTQSTNRKRDAACNMHGARRNYCIITWAEADVV